MASIIKVNTIQDATNSNTAISVDSTGRVTVPNVPCFYVYNNDTNFSGASWQKWGANVAVTNNGSHFDLSNDRFTAPVAGNYFMSWHSLARNTGSGMRVAWYKNGAKLNNPSNANASDIYNAQANEISVAMTGLFSLNATDYIEVYYNAASGDLYGNANHHNAWTGYLIG